MISFTFRRALPFAALAVAVAACSGGGQPDLQTPTLSATDAAFIVGAGEASDAEIAAAKLALTKSTNPDVIAFANLMITDHGQENVALAQVGSEVGHPAPTSVDQTQAATAAMLMPLTGTAFDKAYIDSEIAGHEANLQDNYAPELQSGTNATVRQYATTYQPQVQSHLTKAQAIEAKYGF